MRVMLDTNILVSMIFFPSSVTFEFTSLLTRRHQVVICDYVIEELRLVTERKFPQRASRLDRFLMTFPYQMVFTPKGLEFAQFPSVRDKKDTPILATAILENVDIFVTGDKDFSVLNIGKPIIMTMAEFIEMEQNM